MSPAGEREATRLLLSRLTATQRDTFPHGYFDVTGSRGGQYRVSTRSTIQNITQYRTGGKVEFCVTVAGVQYRPYVWLAQKILIESDEGRFLRTAVAYERVLQQEVSRYQIW